MTLPGVCQPHACGFAAEASGAASRIACRSRRPASARLLEEAAAAGVEQLILVVTPRPSRRRRTRLRPPAIRRARPVGEQLASTESAACADAVAHLQHAHFHAVFVIRPDAQSGAAARSRRRRTTSGPIARTSLAELIERGYEDAYRLFIEPVLGAAGEQSGGGTDEAR